jgi:hypothetical protein
MVERRSSAQGAYGQGIKAPMQLKQLIKELQQGNTGLYMSTQEVRPPTHLIWTTHKSCSERGSPRVHSKTATAATAHGCIAASLAASWQAVW